MALPDRRGLPFQIFPRAYIAASGTLDFHLPDNRFTVEVVDRRDGRGLAGADVEIESSFGEGLISTGDHTGEDGGSTCRRWARAGSSCGCAPPATSRPPAR